MNDTAFITAAPIFIEIRTESLSALRGRDGLDLALEREPDGRLTQGCKSAVIAGLRRWIDQKVWQPRTKAFCGIAASGVALRRFTLPASAREEFQRLLRLQIESEFPISPEELAWGWQPLESNGNGAKREVLVAAVKKQVVEEYADLLTACGVIPVFTLAALARNSLCPAQRELYAVLEPFPDQPELAAFESAAPIFVRTLPASAGSFLPDAVRQTLGADWHGRKIFIAGPQDGLATQLARGLDNGASCEVLRFEPGAGRSAATLGLQKTVAENRGTPPLILEVKPRPTTRSFDLSAPDSRRWAAAAVVMLVLLLSLPYAEGLLFKPILARKLARLKTEEARLTTLDRELDFLQSLKQIQPPYLDALYLFAKFAPQGTKLDSVTMNRRGDVSIRGSLRTADQVTEFRTKLIDSGFFETVSVEEQALSPDRQKVNVQMTAHWKPFEARLNLTNGPTASEIEHAKTNQIAPGGAQFPPGMMPPGMMPGMMPPGGGMPSMPMARPRPPRN